MNAIKEKMAQNKNALIIIIVTVVLVVIISILLGNKVANAPEDQLADSANTEDILENSNGNLSSLNTTGNFTSIKITYPVFSSPDLFDYSGEMTSCKDEIAWVTAYIAPTKAILNATLREMFNNKSDLGFKPGNFVATQNDLKFVEARIDEGVAKIYLSGKFDAKGKCNSERLVIQLEKTALQFSNVESVEIFLNEKAL